MQPGTSNIQHPTLNIERPMNSPLSPKASSPQPSPPLGEEREPESRSSLRFGRSGFTLLEVMIAVGILFMCLFAVLALTANSLASARKIQQHRDLDAGSFVGFFYVQLANTNRIDEGSAEIDLGDSFPGYHTSLDCALVGTNGLWDIEYRVANPSKRAEVHGHFMVFNPNSQQTGINRNLPTHH